MNEATLAFAFCKFFEAVINVDLSPDATVYKILDRATPPVCYITTRYEDDSIEFQVHVIGSDNMYDPFASNEPFDVERLQLQTIRNEGVDKRCRLLKLLFSVFTEENLNVTNGSPFDLMNQIFESASSLCKMLSVF